MIEIAIWKEVGLSEVSDAELRFDRILNDADLVPFSELDGDLQELIRKLRQQLPEVVIVPSAGSDQTGLLESEGLYSRFGVLLRLGDDLPRNTHERILVLTIEPGLTFFDPDMEMVLGRDDSIETTIDE